MNLKEFINGVKRLSRCLVLPSFNELKLGVRIVFLGFLLIGMIAFIINIVFATVRIAP